MIKKIIFVIVVILCYKNITHSEENEFTWAKYEMYCYAHGVEPSYEEYVYLAEHPQCLIFENEQE